MAALVEMAQALFLLFARESVQVGEVFRDPDVRRDLHAGTQAAKKNRGTGHRLPRHTQEWRRLYERRIFPVQSSRTSIPAFLRSSGPGAFRGQSCGERSGVDGKFELYQAAGL